MPLRSNIKIKKIFGFDTETVRKADNKFLMGSIVGENFKYVSWDREKFRKKLLSKQFKDQTIFATNLVFDFCSCFSIKELLDTTKFNYLMHNKSSNFVYVKYIPYNITFLDTLNFFPVSVETLGKNLKCEKLKYPESLNRIKSIKDINGIEEIKEIEDYNIRDSEISYKFAVWIQKILNDIGGNMRYTIASSSMDLFKRKYLKNPIKQPSEEVIRNMYKAYYGGRVETIWRGMTTEKFNYYDINSCYVSVMRKNLPDLNSIKVKQKGNINIIDMYEGISHVSLKVNDLSIPYLPYRTDDKLIFPIGKFSGWYNNFELKNALDMGYEITDIKETIYFTDYENYLIDYADDLYGLRLEDTINQLIYKLLGNSLYGKFAQKIDMDKTSIFHIDDINLDDEVNKELIKDSKIFMNDFFIYAKKQNKFYSTFILPIISLYITSYARDLLYNTFIKNNENDIFYFDTDSGITKKEIKVSKELGGVKKEHIIKEMILVKPKQYYLKNYDNQDIITFKGVPQLNLNSDKFKQIINTGEYEYNKIVKIKECMRRNLKINSEISIKKTFTIDDNKRVWDNDFSLNDFEISKPIKI